MKTIFEVRRKQKKLPRARNGRGKMPRYNSADKKILAGLEDGLALIDEVGRDPDRWARMSGPTVRC